MDFTTVATSRRSVHEYADAGLERETIAEIVEEATAGVHEQVDAMVDWLELERRVWKTRSTAIVAQQLMLAAWNREIATCPMGGFDSEGLCEEFDISDGYEPVLIMTMGHPAEEADDLENSRKWRRPVEEVVHFDEFDPDINGTEPPVAGDDN